MTSKSTETFVSMSLNEKSRRRIVIQIESIDFTFTCSSNTEVLSRSHAADTDVFAFVAQRWNSKGSLGRREVSRPFFDEPIFATGEKSIRIDIDRIDR